MEFLIEGFKLNWDRDHFGAISLRQSTSTTVLASIRSKELARFDPPKITFPNFTSIRSGSLPRSNTLQIRSVAYFVHFSPAYFDSTSRQTTIIAKTEY